MRFRPSNLIKFILTSLAVAVSVAAVGAPNSDQNMNVQPALILPVRLEIAPAMINKYSLKPPIIVKNSTDDCEIRSNDEGATEYLGLTQGQDSTGAFKIVQVLSVQFKSGCRFIFGTVKNFGSTGAAPGFFLLGAASVQNGAIGVSYTQFGGNPEAQIKGLMREILSSGPALPPDHLAVRLVAVQKR